MDKNKEEFIFSVIEMVSTIESGIFVGINFSDSTIKFSGISLSRTDFANFLRDMAKIIDMSDEEGKKLLTTPTGETLQ